MNDQRAVTGLPSALLATFCVLVCFATTAKAQDACSSPDPTISISFPEYPEGQTVPSTDEYRQVILSNGVEPDSLDIGPDPNDNLGTTRLFRDHFTHSYNAFGANPGYVVDFTKGIDRDGLSSVVDDDVNILQYQIVCRAIPGSTIVYKVLRIQILDVNDNAPSFIGTPYNFDVNELTPIGLPVFLNIYTTDLDEGDNKQVEYSLQSAASSQFDGTQFFELPSSSEGLISVKSALDFESLYSATGQNAADTYYNITLVATDKGNIPQSSSTSVVIRIVDGDDQGPEFVFDNCLLSTDTQPKCVLPKYKSSIVSNSPQSQALDVVPVPAVSTSPSTETRVLMQDQDTLNSTISCSIAGTFPSGYENSFLANSTNVSGTKQYECQVTYLGNPVISKSNITNLDIFIEAKEESIQGRIDYATIQLTVMSPNNAAAVIALSSHLGYILLLPIINLLAHK